MNQAGIRRRGAAAAGAALLLTAGSAFGLDQGQWLVRMRAIDVIPQDSRNTIDAAGGGAVAGSGLAVSSAATLEGDVTYMVTSNVGLELIAATTRHTLVDNGVVAGALGLSSHIDGATGALPPTLTVQWHFLPHRALRPYLGAGLNYTLFYDERSGIDAAPRLRLENSVGWAVQTGADFDINSRWFVNVDLKYIDMRPKATYYSPQGAALYDATVKIDPWVVGVGIGTTF